MSRKYGKYCLCAKESTFFAAGQQHLVQAVKKLSQSSSAPEVVFIQMQLVIFASTLISFITHLEMVVVAAARKLASV